MIKKKAKQPQNSIFSDHRIQCNFNKWGLIFCNKLFLLKRKIQNISMFVYAPDVSIIERFDIDFDQDELIN